MNEQVKVILVDENDNQIGSMEKLAAHQQAKLHRAFSVFIIRQGKHEVETLLQQRADSKYHSGGLWSNTCCSHPTPGEDTLDAAHRRLNEELGITNCTLEQIGSFIYKAELDNNLCEYELDHLILGELKSSDSSINPCAAEVQNIQWLPLSELQQQLAAEPQRFSAWLPLAMQQLCELHSCGKLSQKRL